MMMKMVSPNKGKNINKNRVKTVTKSCMRLTLSKICISKKMNLTLKLMFNSDKSQFLYYIFNMR